MLVSAEYCIGIWYCHCIYDINFYQQIHLGLLDKNENKSHEMLEILQHCNTEYVPKARDSSTDDADQYKVLHKVAFGGDHLTVERGISAAAAVGDSDTPFERLEGLILKHEDFHCKMNVLQVGYIVITFTSFELRNVGVAVVQTSFSGVHISRKVSLFNSSCSECKH